MEDLPPEAGGVQHVGLIDGGDLFAALAGGFKSNLQNAADLQLAVSLGVIGLGAVFAIPVATLAEVDAAGQLSDHHQVKALFCGAFPQGTGGPQSLIQPGGAQVGVKSQHRTQLEQSLFGSDITGQAVPLGAAHGAQHDAVGCQTSVDGLLGQRNAAGVDGAAAGQISFAVEGVAKLAAHFFQYLDGVVHDLGADAVALDQCNIEFHRSDLLRLPGGPSDRAVGRRFR